MSGDSRRRTRHTVAALLAAVAVATTTAGVTEARLGPSPLSGLPGGEGKPVFMVKMDNVINARPHTGLVQADLVYVEPVEWGVTRLAAMFNSRNPKILGPVRSARVSDLEILEQFERPGFVYSGANTPLLALIGRSKVVRLSPTEKSGYFYRDQAKKVPHNQMLKYAAMIATVKRLPPINDVGLLFDRTPAVGGTRTKSFLVRWPSATVGGEWEGKAWSIFFDGYRQRDGATRQQVAAKTAIIQFVKQRESNFGDRFGGKTPFPETIGEGRAIILRNGRRFDATWSRPDKASGTTFLVDGQPFALDVGQVWVLLVDRRKQSTVTIK